MIDSVLGKEEADNDARSEPAQRARAASSEPQPPLPDLPDGIIFFSLMNARKNFFVPSTENYFGGIKVSELKCDSGCNSMLLPITNLREIFEKFPCKDFRFEIKSGNGTAGRTIALTVVYKDCTKSFKLEIAKDLILNPVVISHKRLRFSLCEEDKTEILKSEICNGFFTKDSIDKLSSSSIANQTRRHHGLLGRSILSQMASLKYCECELYVNPAQFNMPSTFDVLEGIIGSIKARLWYHLPEGFDDWKDDDFEYEDDERDEEI